MTTEGSGSTELGVDTQPYQGTEVGTGSLTAEGAISLGAPVFTATSSMNPIVVGKGQEPRADRWKANNVETPTSSMQLELSPGFVSPETIYYVPSFCNPIYPEGLTNGDGIHFQQGHIAEPSSPMNGEASTISTEKMPMEDLKRLIRLQFEYYFSRENLANDAYLVSQMDNDQFVSISTVARFNQIKKMTSDLQLIAEALKDSQNITLNENGDKVRANTKRCIVILREIPDSTPLQEIQDIFDSPNCPKWTNCEFAHNNSWYVTFDSEEDAQKAYWYLREEVKNFHGKPIMARIKAKTLLSRTTLMRPQNANQANATQPETSPQPPQQPVFSQRQYSTFQVAAPVIGGQQPFSYYPGAIMQTAWIEPRQQFFPPEMIAQTSQFQPNNFVKPLTITGPRQFFSANKQRVQTKTFFKADNGERLSEKDDRIQGNSFRRPPLVNNRQASHFVQKDNDMSLRRPPHARNKREEVVPRFQRLKERERRQMEQNSPPENDANNLNLDLAPENFPALPSPSSPNEKPSQQTSSLKELATNALNKTNVQIEKVEKSDESASDIWVCWNNKLPKSPCNPPLENGISDEKSPIGLSTSPPLCVTPPLQESNTQSPFRPSYAQIAQKPKSKTAAAAKSANEQSESKESRSPKAEQGDNINGNKKGNNSRKNSDNKEDKENLKNENTNTNGLSPKPPRHSREARISSDPGMRSTPKASGIPTRNNSYNGPDSSAVKESYASKSSANINSPPSNAKATGQGPNQGQIKPTASKNNTKGHANATKSQIPIKEASAAASISTGTEISVKVEQNNNKKEEGNNAEDN